MGGTMAVWVSALSRTSSVSVTYSGLHSLGMLVCAAVGMVWLARHRVAAALLAACSVALVLSAAQALLHKGG